METYGKTNSDSCGNLRQGRALKISSQKESRAEQSCESACSLDCKKKSRETTSQMKVCTHCKVLLPLLQFYRRPLKMDGHINKCKSCVKDAVSLRIRRLKASSLEWVEKEAERSRKKQAARRVAGKAGGITAGAATKWDKTNPHKKRAHLEVSRAIKSGNLIPSLCQCGQKAEAHHEDYTKPFDVTWLCRAHHKERHVQINKDRRAAAFFINKLQTK